LSHKSRRENSPPAALSSIQEVVTRADATIRRIGILSGKAVLLAVVSAVLFDLDGTLLDIEINRFFGAYFAALGPVVAAVMGSDTSAEEGVDAVLEGTRAMSAPHPGATNREVFNARFAEITGLDLSLERYSRVFDRFYEKTFPALRGRIEPHPCAREAVQTALDLGMKVAIATNPIFPRAAILERMRWACVDDLPVDVITSYENMHAAKPQATYFAETAELLEVAPTEALMVGDDRFLDMPAADVGMKTFYVGEGIAPGTDWSGSLEDLLSLLPRLR
jgi:FMN phosphatase YigB (HAD superfamily)